MSQDNLNKQLLNSDIWNNPFEAQTKSKQQTSLNGLIEPWITLKSQVDDIVELVD